MPAEGAKVLVIGTGAQAKFALETFKICGIDVAAIMNCEQRGEVDWAASYGAPVVPNAAISAAARSLGATHFLVCNADAARKREWFVEAMQAGMTPINAMHPRAVIASTARIGDGVIVNAGAVLQPFAVIGDGCMIHSGTIVEHDCRVGDYANLAPGVRLAGWCTIGEGARVFTGASLIPKVRIGANAVVAAGATVIRDVEPGWLVAGVPARPVKRLTI